MSRVTIECVKENNNREVIHMQVIQANNKLFVAQSSVRYTTNANKSITKSTQNILQGAAGRLQAIEFCDPGYGCKSSNQMAQQEPNQPRTHQLVTQAVTNSSQKNPS